MTDKYDAAASVDSFAVPPKASLNPYRVANDAGR
jgi:hypothetical protein